MKSPDQTAFKAILILTVLFAIVMLPMVSRADCSGHGHPPSFEDFDADGDGFVSEEEFLTMRSQRMAEKAGEGRPMKGAANAPPFSDVDTDGDGKLDRDEFTAGRDAHMKQMRESGMGGAMHHGEGMKMPTFKDLDLDGDGCISPEEFTKHHAEHHGRRHGQDH